MSEHKELSRRQFFGQVALDAAVLTSYSAIYGFGINMVKYSLDNSRATTLLKNPASLKQYIRYAVQEPFLVGRMNLQIIGVSHIVPTFEAHQDDFVGYIQQTPFVVLEYFNDSMRELAKPDTSDDKLLTPSSAYQLVDNFFALLGRACARENKDIVVVNPHTLSSELLSSTFSYGLLAELALSDIENLRKKISGQMVNRRNFLRFFGYILGLTSLASEFDYTKPLRQRLEEEHLLPNSEISSEKQADLLGFYHQDWRDIQTAKGIKKISQVFNSELDEELLVPVIEGAWHNGKYEYLQNPLVAETKDKLYAAYNFVGNHSLRRYHFDNSANKWGLSVNIPL